MKPKPYWCDLTVHALDSRPFSYHEATQTLSVEASSLEQEFKLHRLYQDACDSGIAIRSHRTGKVERFVLTTVDESDGDIHGWNFVPENPASSCGVKRVLIIND